MKSFQTIVFGLFIFFVIAGVIAFATFRGGSEEERIEPVTLWGTLPAEEVSNLIAFVRLELELPFPVTYREVREDDFDRTLVEALASGRGPDLMLLPQDLIARHSDKVFVIPFESLSERDFRDMFIEEGELYLTRDGSLGLPFTVDPLVLYWNRTLFANAGIAQPPRFWDELLGMTARLTLRDERNNILQSAIALGEFGNVTHAKDILSTLIMQAGGPIVRGTATDLDVVLNERLGAPEVPAESALRFYTEFANPVKPVYSWNRSLLPSRDAFIAGDTAMYIGFASELFALQERNPNLNFDVTLLPQVRDAEQYTIFANMQAVSILKSSPNIASAFQVAGVLTRPEVLRAWEDVRGLPPVRRDLLGEVQTDAFRDVFYRSALIADAFLDPNPQETETIFRDMVEGVTSGRTPQVGSAVLQADDRLEQLVE